jgi:hypothetical protein
MNQYTTLVLYCTVINCGRLIEEVQYNVQYSTSTQYCTVLVRVLV